MNDRRSLHFLLLWLVTGTIPAVLLPVVAHALVVIGGASLPLGPVLFSLFILSFAGGQAFALRSFVPWGGNWFWYSAIGCLVAMLVTLPALAFLDPFGWSEPAVLSITHALGGFTVGTFQWLAFRRHIRGAWMWIVLNGVLWGALIAAWYPLFDATWAPGRMPIAFEGDHELRQLLRVAASAAIVTGPILLRLLRSGAVPRDRTLLVGNAA